MFIEGLIGAPVRRGEAEQRAVDDVTKYLSLYHFTACSYCVRVRWVMRKLKLDIGLRDITRFLRQRFAGG